MNMLCVGLVVCDVILRPVPKDIMQMDSCSIDKPIYTVGGDAANVAITMQKLGVNTTLVGYLGKDSNGDFVHNYLAERGVSTDGLLRHPEAGTVVSYVVVEDSGERHFVAYDYLNHILCEKEITEISDDLLKSVDLVFLGSAMAMKGMDETGAVALFKKAHSLGKMTAADTSCNTVGKDSRYWQTLLEAMLFETDIFVPSYDEAVMITGEKDLSKMRSAFSQYGIKYLVIKLGEKGCYITDFSNEQIIPAFKFSAIDTTGAGDAFVGGLLFGLSTGWSLESAAVFANATAGFNVTKVGATGGVPDFDTVYNFLIKNGNNANQFPLGKH